MRTLSLLTAVLVAGLGLATSAQADPTVVLTWTGTTGTGTTGCSDISAEGGDVLTLQVDLIVGANGVSVQGMGFIWDNGGTSVLDFLSEVAD